MIWNRVVATFVDVLFCLAGGISRASAVFYNTAAAWIELEMLPKAVHFCFLFVLHMIYYFRISRVNIICLNVRSNTHKITHTKRKQTETGL